MAEPAFIERLNLVCSEGKFRSRAALARAAGVPAASLQKYFEGSEPTRLALAALAQAGNVSLEWLATGQGPKERRPPIPDGYGQVMMYDLRESGGHIGPFLDRPTLS